MSGRPASAAFWSVLRRIAYFGLPPLFAVWFYAVALRAWFMEDDFAWLKHAGEFQNFHEFLHALFDPMAQGTIRVWSERVYFIVLSHAFGLNAVPFHVVILLTQCANLVLLLAIVPRLTGSRVAGFAAALLWTVNPSLSFLMVWSAAYNQPLCALFLLGAFYFLLRYLETGRRRYWIWQWVVFVLGFGANELNAVYPALAAAYTFFCARKYFRRTLPLFIPSIIFAVVHRLATPISGQSYQLHFDLGMVQALATYWEWTFGAGILAHFAPLASWIVIGSMLLLTAGLIAVAVSAIRHGAGLPLFCFAWYFIALAPMLPLTSHLTEYYVYIPSIGLAILAGGAIARAWPSPLGRRAVTAGLVFVYAWFSVQGARLGSRWEVARSRNTRTVVLGVQHAHELHPTDIILLDEIDSDVFWTTMIDHPFRLIGIGNVYLTPGSEKRIEPHPDIGDPAEFIFPPGPTYHALTGGEAVVYTVSGDHLRNITRLYMSKLPREWLSLKPQRVEVANPAEAYLLGPSWHRIEFDHRWMPLQATVELAGPPTAAARLHLSGTVGGKTSAVSVSIDGVRLPSRRLASAAPFDVEWPAPPQSIGKPSVQVLIEADRAVAFPPDKRLISLSLGVVEFR